jgi:hypothetical protein
VGGQTKIALNSIRKFGNRGQLSMAQALKRNGLPDRRKDPSVA